MILNIEFDGYKFFDNSSISFTADARTKKLLSNSTELDGKNVLKAVGLYGSNNSGKTNIVKLMSLIKKVLIGADNILFNNLRLDFYNISISFHIQIIQGGNY